MVLLMERVLSCESRVASKRLAISTTRDSRLTTRNSARRAISLIEVLISMFVLLFGLMGVAAIFPVGNHYVMQGENADLGAAIAQNAFEELRARGMLRPEFWYYPTPLPNGSNSGNLLVMFPGPPAGTLQQQLFNASQMDGPGHAFVIDPMGAADGLTQSPQLNGLDVFPYTYLGNLNANNPWYNGSNTSPALSGERWPVRRITVADSNGLMSKPVAETIFRLRDDLAVELPDESDRPSIQRWDTADVDPTSGNPNNTPNDPSDDTPLRRQYKGDFSWLATIVPVTSDGLVALQPASPDYGEISCDVSVVVFRKRVETPSAESERLIEAELLQGGELVLYSRNSDRIAAKQEVDESLEDLLPGNWISVMGVNQSSGDFIMKWYRILSMGTDEDTTQLTLPGAGVVVGRRAMIFGADWPATLNPRTGLPLEFVANLRAAILPGVITVVTKPLRMEDSSLWNLQ